MKTALILLKLLLISSVAIAQTNILVVYHSETGNTKKMAESVAQGAGTVEGVTVTILTTEQTDESDLLNADAIIVGSPVYNANVSPEVQRFISTWPFDGEPLKNKVGAAFVTSAGISAGEEIVQMNILHSMLIFGMIIVGGPEWNQPFGASAITGEQPFTANSPDQISKPFLEKGRLLGQRVARITQRLHNN